MITLLVGIGIGMAGSGLAMAWLERAYLSPGLVPHRFAEPKPVRTSDRDKQRLFALNSLLSVVLIVGLAVGLHPWLFTEEPVGGLRMAGQAFGILAAYDLLYYALHRWVFHHKKLMRHVHGLHHQARTPTARESLFTHPVELLSGLAVLLTSTWLVSLAGPVHVVAFGVAFVVYSLMNVFIHSGISFPSGPLRVFNLWARKHHGHHGVDMNRNFGSLSPVWDVLFGTSLP